MNTLQKDLKILMKMCGICCLIPRYDLKISSFKKSRLHVTLTMLTFIFALVVSMMGRFEVVYKEESEDIILYCLPSVIITFSHIFMMFNMNVVNYNKNQVLFKKLHSYDDQLLRFFARNVKAMKRTAQIYFFIINIMSLFIPFYEIIYSLRIGESLGGFEFQINDIIQFYFMFILMLYQCLILKAVKWRCSILNSLIRKGEFMKPDFRQGFITPDKIDRVVYLHNTLSDISDIINDLFGWYNLLTFVHMFIRLLGVINSYLFASYAWDEISFSLFWHFYIVLHGIVVAIRCGQVTDEGKKTVAVSYKAVYKFSPSAPMKNKLLILSQQASARIPQFTAAGFFNIDNSMLFTFVNLITTYVIVIIQFSGSQ